MNLKIQSVCDLFTILPIFSNNEVIPHNQVGNPPQLEEIAIRMEVVFTSLR